MSEFDESVEPADPAPETALTSAAEAFEAEPSFESVVELRHVAHAFKQHKALVDVSFRVPKESLHGFVGPNGAGKTTVLKLICTLLQPQIGSVRVFGLNVASQYREVRKRLGFMPDHFSMYRQMTVFEYLDFFGAAYGLPLATRTRVINDVLELTDMSGRRQDLINGLSRGMQQRVGLARVLVNDPDLLLLDEPASGLDPRARIELMEILRALRSMGKTIIISSHILSELAELCDSVTIIDRGRVKYNGTMGGLLDGEDEYPRWRLTPAEPLNGLVETISNSPGIMGVDPIEGSQDVHIAFDPAFLDTNGVLNLAMNLGISVRGFTKSQKHLNQAFMDLTEKGVRE
ncbi:MAG: ABC transporter ATP-binding protein [Planctomycetota bacterium]|nr:ABC transporter ATP-binding protein [Planctomycetota bacterium]MDA1248020.1 ABC transporter ATP-binding protein [Planctomycetota bacterium]